METALMAGSIFPESSNSSFGDDVSVSSSVARVEEELQREAAERDQDFRNQMMEQGRKSESKEEVFKRLQELLSRSQFYAEFLANKIVTHKEAEEAAIQKKLQKQMKNTLKDSNSLQDQNKDFRPQRNVKRPSKFNSSPVQAVRNPKRAKLSKKHKELDDSLASELSDDGFVEDEEIEMKKSVVSRMPVGADASRQPVLVTGGIMRDYQLEGFEWLKVLYENAVNGILADEMGLGKTIQTIALLSHLQNMGVDIPHLICAPLSTIGNWVNEFNRFAPDITVLMYYGNKNERAHLRKKLRRKRSGINVVITSYQVAVIDRPFLEYQQFGYLIIDEGHKIKNFQGQLVRELKKYSTQNRLLLTGTPLQNDLSELWSLLNFLLPEVFDDLRVFQSWFDVAALEQKGGDNELLEQEKENHIISTLHAILSPFVLRRTKAEVNILLPPKKELLVYAPLSELQMKFYKATLDKTIESLVSDATRRPQENIVCENTRRSCAKRVDYSVFGDAENVSDGDEDEMSNEEEEERKMEAAWAHKFELVSAIKKKEIKDVTREVRVNTKNSMALLRKICNHPYLVEYPLTADGQYKIDEDLILKSGKLRVLDSMLKELKKRGHKVLIFSQSVQLLEVLQDYCYYRRFGFCQLNGQMKLSDREVEIQRFNEQREAFVFLVSTRAGGLGINLTAADTVIIFDSDWNPQSDLQAQDRCHRFGQTKPVVIYRLVTADTVDERIVTRAAAKRKLEKLIMRKGRFNGKVGHSEVLSLEDMKSLLESVNQRRVVVPESGDLYTAEQLEMLLDRSDLLSPERRSSQTSDDQGEENIHSLFKVIPSDN